MHGSHSHTKARTISADQTTSSPVSFDARWLWLNVEGALAKDALRNIPLSALNVPVAPGLAFPLAKPFVEAMRLGVPQDAGTFGYHGAGECIYCEHHTANGDDVGRTLGDEHIIPAGLGGAAILPQASCKRHERITSKMETKLLHRLFDPARKHRNIRQRDGRPIKKGNFPVFRTVDGEHVGLPMPIKDHPTVLFLPKLAPPGILTGRPNWTHGVVGVWLANINAHAELLRRQRITSFSTPAVDTIGLAQLLSKIAHAYACAEILRSNFEPLLIELIELDTDGLDNEHDRYRLVGGDVHDNPPTPYLHELGLGLHQIGSTTFLVARVRLFSYLGAPVFLVVAGTVPESKRTAVTKRLSQNNSRTHAT